MHFPVALLFIYSIIKIFPFQKWISSVAWKQFERACLVIGTLGAFAAGLTGEIAKHLIKTQNRHLIGVHSSFAQVTTFVYCLILLGEVASFLNSKYPHILLAFTEKILCNKIFSKILALVGLVGITVTGLLGGVIVYGATADPFANIVLKILGINL